MASKKGSFESASKDLKANKAAGFRNAAGKIKESKPVNMIEAFGNAGLVIEKTGMEK